MIGHAVFFTADLYLITELQLARRSYNIFAAGLFHSINLRLNCCAYNTSRYHYPAYSQKGNTDKYKISFHITSSPVKANRCVPFLIHTETLLLFSPDSMFLFFLIYF